MQVYFLDKGRCTFATSYYPSENSRTLICNLQYTNVTISQDIKHENSRTIFHSASILQLE